MCAVCGRYKCPSSCPNADEPEPICRCDECGAKLFAWDQVTKLKGFTFCEDCVAVNTRSLEE